MDALTARQRQVLQYIVDFKVSHGRPPTRAEIAGGFGFRSANAAEDHLKALAKKKALFLDRGKARGICLIDESRLQA